MFGFAVVARYLLFALLISFFRSLLCLEFGVIHVLLLLFLFLCFCCVCVLLCYRVV